MSGFVTGTPQVRDPSLSWLFNHSLKAGSMCVSGTTSFSEVTVICQFDKTAYPLSHIDHLFNIVFGTTSSIEAKFKLSEILGSPTPTKWGRVFASRKRTSLCQTTCRNFFANEESFICLYCIFIYLLLIVHALILADLLHCESVSTKKDCTREMESILHYRPSYGANGRMIGAYRTYNTDERDERAGRTGDSGGNSKWVRCTRCVQLKVVGDLLSKVAWGWAL